MLLSQLPVQILEYVNYGIAIALTLLYLMQNVHLIVAVFTPHKRFKKAKKQHNFGYLICGRNEQEVIGNLVDSIYKQDYPRELMKVFVCADNCTDNTAEIARNHGAIVYERHNDKLKGKSYALDYLLNQVLKDESNKEIEAFFVFDADNLVTKDYTKHMNETYDAGSLVSTSFRDSKNFSHSLAAACSSVMFYRECLLIHHSRQLLGLGTFVSGTGYYVDRKILEKLNGWHFNTLTEDIEFSCWCAANKIKIGYNQEAIFFDEQPNTMHAADKQRLRWCKGTHQCAHLYCGKLFFNAFGINRRSPANRLSCFEMFVHVFPSPIMCALWMVIYGLLHTIFFATGLETQNEYIHTSLTMLGWELFAIFGLALIHAIICTAKYYTHIQANFFKKLLAVFMFPFFAAMYIPLSFVALFKKEVKWDHIAHTEDIKIEELTK